MSDSNTDQEEADNQANNKDCITIRKYANRRLYNTNNSKYINLDDLREMVCNNINFKVVDAKTNADLTRAVLSQIILDAEIKGDHIFPVTFLKKIIQVYDNQAEKYIFPNFLDETMKFYKSNQSNIMESIGANLTNLSGVPGLSQLSEINRKNYELMMSSFGMLFNTPKADSDKANQDLSSNTGKKDNQENTPKLDDNLNQRMKFLEQQFESFQNLIKTIANNEKKDKD